MTTIWLSFDVEATGPIPGLHSMLSLGIVPVIEIGEGPAGYFEVLSDDYFSVNIRELDDASWDVDTEEWWRGAEREEAFEVTTANPMSPTFAMQSLMQWLIELRQTYPTASHVWAAYPATFDMPFLRYYAQRFVPTHWTEFYDNDVMQRVACFDMGSLAMQLLDVPYHDVSKKRMPPHWRRHMNPLLHVARHDAEEQAQLLVAMLLDAQEARAATGTG